jgi:hypothetical protein
MPDVGKTRPSRRTMLRSVAAVTGIGAAGVVTRPGDASAATVASGARPDRPLQVRRLFRLLDREGLQRFRLSSTKPPVYVDGTTYPASDRQGPDDGTWITFNDQNQNEKGGLTASTTGASISFDYLHSQGVTLATQFEADAGAAGLIVTQMPDPSIPLADLTAADAPERIILYTDTAGSGSLLNLCDSEGRPRITLQVDGNDVPRIQILDPAGNVVAQLPADALPSKPAAKSARRLLRRTRPT